ncbi:MAG: phosphate acyltransferase PlsX [Eubacteriales bacterium]|jgi:glycerol-3-phosphate acyltransferase PlsX|nr:phosphate acyltransferase PlsX [Eubacteriales bacterium]MDD3290069.1 phosphate acyltransferase PlsX [Eubacteriales bacterium]MDD3863080.1 phosphate acyltransferase PlsX [Eubacteriales bacterium]MDD4445175.1 phosphate acyltransferase PlsX [Eubacteriales bacterium]
MRIAIDAMGGDHAPQEIVRGCLQASGHTEAELILVGDHQRITDELTQSGISYDPARIRIMHAQEVIENTDSPVRAVRGKPDSSMVRAIELVKSGEADAVLSAGNTGALMAAGLLRLGRIKGVERPAIVSIYPLIGQEKAFSLLVDAGANAECKASNLLGFAHMGSIYMKSAFGVESPTVGLINIGAEETKGTAQLKDTYQLLKTSGLNFIGNVEGRDIPGGAADVLVCDGFTGNVILKLTEGLAWTILKTIKRRFTEDVMAKLGAAILSGKLRDLKKEFDYSTYGGAPILGIRGLVFKMHGSSTADAVRNSVIKAALVASGDLTGQIRQAMEAYANGEEGTDPDEE